MDNTETSSASDRQVERLLVTEAAVHIALASFMLERAGSRVGIDEFIVSCGIPLPRLQLRNRLWKSFLYLVGVRPIELHDARAILVSPDLEPMFHALQRVGAALGCTQADRPALAAFLVTYEEVSRIETLEAEFGCDDGVPEYLFQETLKRFRQFDEYETTPLCRTVNALLRWLSDHPCDLSFDQSLVRTFAIEYGSITDDKIAERDAEVLWQALNSRLRKVLDDPVISDGTRAVARLAILHSGASWQKCGSSTRNEVHHLLSA